MDLIVYLAPAVLAVSAFCLLFTLDNVFISTLLLIFIGGSAVEMFGITWTAVSAHPGLLVTYLAAYIGVGLLWVWVAWFSFVRGVAEKYSERRTRWFDLSNRGTGPLNDQQRSDLNAYMLRAFNFSIPIVVREHKSRLITWMMFWPFSVVSTIVKDPIRRFYNLMYDLVSHGMQRIADRALVPFKSDFKHDSD